MHATPTLPPINMVSHCKRHRPLVRAFELFLIGLLLQAIPQTASAGGTWAPVTPAPDTFRSLLLLSDGTVMAAAIAPGADAGNKWYRLTPDSHGSYAAGKWSTLPSMHDTRFAYSSAVLRDGRVFIAGGEYGSGNAAAEIYDPLANTWTLAPPSGQSFLDSICKILPGGE